MSFDWPEYLTLATEILEIPSSTVSEEARWRAAISRAYYAVYHTALATARTKDGYRQPPNTGVHEGLVRHFETHRNAKRNEIGADLDFLREMRTKADYYKHSAPPPINRNTTLLCLELADQVIAALRTL